MSKLPAFAADASIYQTRHHYRSASGANDFKSFGGNVFLAGRLPPLTPAPAPTPPLQKLPPLTLGDLGCGLASSDDWSACKNYCATNYPGLCAAMCTYRKNDAGECVLWVDCMDCNEIPGQVLPDT